VGCGAKGIVILIYSVANNIPIEKLKHYTINYIDGDVYNLCSDNLHIDRFINISHDKKYIYLKDTAGNSAFCDYSIGLLKLIQSRHWHYNKQKNEFATNFEKPGTAALHELCYVYYFKKANADNFKTVIKKFKKDNKTGTRRTHQTVDHKNSAESRSNNTKENLQLLPLYLNIRKWRHTARLKPHHFYTPVKNGEIIGRLVYKNGFISYLYNSIFSDIFGKACDIQLLPDETDKEKSINNLVGLLRDDVIPENTVNLKTSWLQYGLGALCVYGAYKHYCDETKVGVAQ